MRRTCVAHCAFPEDEVDKRCMESAAFRTERRQAAWKNLCVFWGGAGGGAGEGDLIDCFPFFHEEGHLYIDGATRKKGGTPMELEAPLGRLVCAC